MINSTSILKPWRAPFVKFDLRFAGKQIKSAFKHTGENIIKPFCMMTYNEDGYIIKEESLTHIIKYKYDEKNRVTEKTQDIKMAYFKSTYTYVSLEDDRIIEETYSKSVKDNTTEIKYSFEYHDDGKISITSSHHDINIEYDEKDRMKELCMIPKNKSIADFGCISSPRHCHSICKYEYDENDLVTLLRVDYPSHNQYDISKIEYMNSKASRIEVEKFKSGKAYKKYISNLHYDSDVFCTDIDISRNKHVVNTTMFNKAGTMVFRYYDSALSKSKYNEQILLLDDNDIKKYKDDGYYIDDRSVWCDDDKED